MVFPKEHNDLLILFASFNCMPVGCVFDARSEPAKSTQVNLPVKTLPFVYLRPVYKSGRHQSGPKLYCWNPLSNPNPCFGLYKYKCPMCGSKLVS